MGKLSEGIPELNITSLDPFYLNEYLMHFDSTQIEGKSLFKDVYNHGLGSIKIVDVRLDIGLSIIVHYWYFYVTGLFCTESLV